MTTNSPSTKDMFSELISAPSVSSAHAHIDQSNEAVIHILAGWLKTLGFKIDIVAQQDDPKTSVKKSNLIATLGSGEGGLILAGHTDTVPFDEQRWQSDPFKLSERDDRFYGLGTADMKGFFPLVINAVSQFKASDFKQPLIILATSDEETSMSGAKTLVKLGKPKAPYALIGEPTSLKPVRMHKGIMMEAIKVTGRSGHSSDPALGLNSIEVMNDVINDLQSWRKDLQNKHQNKLFVIPHPTLNLGCIHGGDNPNRICGACELHIDLRPIPGMPIDGLREELQLRMGHIAQKWQCEIETEALFDGIPAFETDANSALVQSVENLTGHKAESTAFGTEGPYLKDLGAETVILGPGDLAQAHQPDEYIALDTLDPMTQIIKQLIIQYCL